MVFCRVAEIARCGRTATLAPARDLVSALRLSKFQWTEPSAWTTGPKELRCRCGCWSSQRPKSSMAMFSALTARGM